MVILQGIVVVLQCFCKGLHKRGRFVGYFGVGNLLLYFIRGLLGFVRYFYGLILDLVDENDETVVLWIGYF